MRTSVCSAGGRRIPRSRRPTLFGVRNRLANMLVAGLAAVVSLGSVLLVGAPSAHALRPGNAASTQAQVDQQRAIASYQALQQYLYVPTYELYKAPNYTDTNPVYSYLWPFTNAMAGTDYLAGSPGGTGYGADLQARLDGLLKYRNYAEHTPSGTPQPPAFQSAVPPPLGPGGDTFYDDNAWASLDLLHQYALTKNPTYLSLAEDTFHFVVTGWSTNSLLRCPGGVYWVDASWNGDRNVVSNAPNAEAGLQLYRLTGDSFYLSWAQRMYNWVNQCLTAPNGLYYDHISPDGSINTTEWSYNQGTMVGAGVLLYQVTGKTSYLNRAVRTAQAAVAYYGTGSQLDSQGPAFNGIYFRNLFLLNQFRPSSAYANEAEVYGSDMWNQNRDASTGLFLPTSQVNATAPMAEIYSLLAGASP